MDIFKTSGESNVHQGGEPLCYLETVVLHVRNINTKMPWDRAMVKVEPRLEFILGYHSILLGLSVGYILAYTVPPLSVTELVIARDMVSQLSLWTVLVVLTSNRGKRFVWSCVRHYLVRFFQLLFPWVLHATLVLQPGSVLMPLDKTQLHKMLLELHYNIFF